MELDSPREETYLIFFKKLREKYYVKNNINQPMLHKPIITRMHKTTSVYASHTLFATRAGRLFIGFPSNSGRESGRMA